VWPSRYDGLTAELISLKAQGVFDSLGGRSSLARVGQAQRVIQLAVGQQPSIGSERGPRNCIQNRASAHLYPLHPLGLPLPPLFIPRKLLNFNPKPPQVRSKSLLHLGNAGLKRFAIATGVALIAPLSANAEVFVSGQGYYVEASYLPNAAGFVLDAGYSGCPPGDYLQWRGPDNDGNPSVVPPGLDMLTAAAVNHAPVGVSFSSGCTVHYLYLQPPSQINNSVNQTSTQPPTNNNNGLSGNQIMR